MGPRAPSQRSCQPVLQRCPGRFHMKPGECLLSVGTADYLRTTIASYRWIDKFEIGAVAASLVPARSITWDSIEIDFTDASGRSDTRRAACLPRADNGCFATAIAPGRRDSAFPLPPAVRRILGARATDRRNQDPRAGHAPGQRRRRRHPFIRSWPTTSRAAFTFSPTPAVNSPDEGPHPQPPGARRCGGAYRRGARSACGPPRLPHFRRYRLARPLGKQPPRRAVRPRRAISTASLTPAIR